MSMRYRYVTPDRDAPGKTKEVFVDVPAEVRDQGPEALQMFHQEQLMRYPEPPQKNEEVATNVID